MLLAHGVGSKEDLPIPFGYALTGAGVAILVSFLVLLFLWREPRFDPERAGRPLPAPLARLIDSPVTRFVLRAVGLVATAYVVLAMVFGKDDALNPTAGVVYVLLWVGVPLLSVLIGPVWRLINPIRTLHLLLSRGMAVQPERGLSPLPSWLGYWPAAASLLAFVWLELIAPDNTSLTVLRLFFAVYLAAHLLAATWYGSRWFDHCDGFEVFSSLLGRLSVLGRRPSDGVLVLRNPLEGVASIAPVGGLFAVVGVLLGSTVFDSLSSSPSWVDFAQTSPLPPRVVSTLGLLTVVAIVTVAFAGASALTGRGTDQPPLRLAAEFAHSLVPIVAGYFVAHYWSLLVIVGQQTLIQLSDPLGTGADLLGTDGLTINGSLAGRTTTAVLQVAAVVTGHVLGVILAHDRAVRLLPRRHAIAGQIPLLVLMVGYTVGGLTLLFAA
ncbi:MAG: hypothetical protein QOI54_311 [Actinomycetota bacterium]|jgi:hypothetical protein|nr:hypothetical protein [Actinomycetota bacterium]